MLASGGNDNKLYVWSPVTLGARSTAEPLCRFNDHTAAVKAVAWYALLLSYVFILYPTLNILPLIIFLIHRSPHTQGLLASGGGTADRHIRFWNAQTSAALHRIDTGSQVCNLGWSTTVNEIVSTHGYSLNQVIVWKYPSMQKIACLTGHTTRYATHH